MLVMLVEGPAAAIVDRYTSNSDGVAAYRALERAVEQHGSEMFLPLLKKKISDTYQPHRRMVHSATAALPDLSFQAGGLWRHCGNQDEDCRYPGPAVQVRAQRGYLSLGRDGEHRCYQVPH